jgi:L-threonylcarbamoyladenylate synthase
MKPSYSEDIKQAIIVLSEGGIILYPTDTIWGLGCDATNPEAVDKIFMIKKRAESKSLIILVNGFSMLERYVRDIPDAAKMILNVSESPLTIIFPKGKNLASGVCNEDGSVGVRISNDDFSNELITRFRKPLVSTSPNISGIKSPHNFTEIDTEIIRLADYVVKYRRDEREKKKPSSIISIDNDGVIKILRE